MSHLAAHHRLRRLAVAAATAALPTAAWAASTGAQDAAARLPASEAVTGVRALEERLASVEAENRSLNQTVAQLRSQLGAAKGNFGDGQNAALEERLRNLESQNQSLNQTVAQLRSQLGAATSDSGKRQSAALTTAEQEVTAARNDNDKLRAEVSTLTATNGQLRQVVQGTQGQAQQTAATLAQSQAGLKRAGRDNSGLKAQNETLQTRHAADEAALARSQDRNRQITGELEESSRGGPRWLWATTAAVFAAGLASASVRRWWSRPVHVQRPVTVSAELGAWKLSPSAPASRSAFDVTAHWFPGATRVHAAGPLVVRPRVAPVEGEAA